MNDELKQELLDVYRCSFNPPYTEGIIKWAEDNIVLPSAYAIPGNLDLSTSPYLHEPLKALDNPAISQVNMACATQIGKSLIGEIFIPYSVINNPKPIMRIFQNNDISATFAQDRLIPLLKACKPTAELLKYDRHSCKKTAITFPHISVTMKGANEGIAHGLSVGYLICEELHAWEPGYYNKFVARTTAFSGRRKIIVASQPNHAGSEWENVYNKGRIFEWQWQCPNCKTIQPFHWNKRRNDDSYAGFNWDTVLNDDGTTNIGLSSRTTWLECDPCKHKVTDTPANRRLLNDTGKYVCIKNDGANDVVSYTCPNFVNINLSFESAASQYMMAKRTKKLMYSDEDLNNFVNQILGKFYRAEPNVEFNKMVADIYEKEALDKEWIKTIGCDVQRNGGVKYYVVRAWNKKGNESRLIEYGIIRKFDELKAIQEKHGVIIPLVGVDSGDQTNDIYQACIRYGKVHVLGNKQAIYLSWVPFKGEGLKLSFPHNKGNERINRYYSEVSNQDCEFPIEHKLRGIPAPLVFWSNPSIKTILARLRDNQVDGVKWRVDTTENDYITHMYSEGLKEVVDKKTGATVHRWMMTGKDNHYWDCECINLVLAIRAGVFSPTELNENDLKKAFDAKEGIPAV